MPLLLSSAFIASATAAPIGYWGAVVPGVDQQEEVPEKKSPQVAKAGIKEYASRLQLGANYTYVNLKPRGKTSFRGNLGGLQGLYEFWASSHFYAAAKLAWRQGNMHGSSGDRSLAYVDTQERLGYALGCDRTHGVWTFFSGLGYRYQGEHFKPKSGSSVTFNYSEFYVPVGVTTEFTVNSSFAVGCNFTWMPQIFPTVWIDPLRGASWSLKKKLANVSVELPLDFNLTKDNKCHLIITPFYEYWQDGRSTAKTASGIPLGIPTNTYQFGGVNVNFGYCF